GGLFSSLPDFFYALTNQPVERFSDRVQNFVVREYFPHFNHRVGRAGMTQRVIPVHLPVKAGIPAITKTTFIIKLRTQVLGSTFYHFIQYRNINTVDNSMTGTKPFPFDTQ